MELEILGWFIVYLFTAAVVVVSGTCLTLCIVCTLWRLLALWICPNHPEYLGCNPLPVTPKYWLIESVDGLHGKKVPGSTSDFVTPFASWKEAESEMLPMRLHGYQNLKIVSFAKHKYDL